ncbi:induced myeloid leukemia cell differentiation protein Mcl-1-like [Sminthopsis crassicaudata]|uniref:induced myeloid leukemia cell differentiation protein Mcl-1-like n=1 Tax=Sminthopsis crassicaudata TaxID=9301 RepID=UPI003D683F98
MLGPFKKEGGLNLHCGGAGGGHLLPSGKETAEESSQPRQDGGEAEAATMTAAEAVGATGGSGGAKPPDPEVPGVRGGAQAAPIGAEAPDGPALPRAGFSGAAAGAADAVLSPGDERDGSEPPGERPPSGSTPPRAAEEDELYRQSLELITRYLLEQAAGTKDAKPLRSGKALETLRRVGDYVQRRHQTAFRGMLRKLDIKKEEDVEAMSRVAMRVFSDGVANWGRVVTLISFGAFVAKHLRRTQRESCIEPLAGSIADALLRSKRDWLVKQQGWEGFVEFFHVEDLEGGMRSLLFTFVGVAGVAAGLAYLMRALVSAVSDL